jgi:hypothetical protein
VNKSAVLVVVMAVLSLSVAVPRSAVAQHQQTREGFWFNLGLGYGSLGCQDCGSRTGSVSGAVALGGTLSQKVVIGGGTTGWTKSENGVTLTVSTLTFLVRFYPSATGGFFLLGGLGVGQIHGEVSGFGSSTETGEGAVLGLGYDFRVGSNVSLTPFWNGFAVNTSNADATPWRAEGEWACAEMAPTGATRAGRGRSI